MSLCCIVSTRQRNCCTHQRSVNTWGVRRRRWWGGLSPKPEREVWFLQLHYGPIFYARKQLCFQRVLAIAILSVRLSVTRVDQAKTVQARISKSSPSAAWKTLVLGTLKLFINSKGVTPNEVAKWEGGGQNLRFLANNSLYLINGAR